MPVFDPDSPEEAFALQALDTAKRLVNQAGLPPPTAFVFCEDGLAVVELAEDATWNDPDVRERAMFWLRRFAREKRAHFIALVVDSWRVNFQDMDAIYAAGLDPHQYKTWPPEVVARHPYTRREALSLTLESRAGTRIVTQFYRRDKHHQIHWLESDVITPDTKEGRLFNLLPKTN